MAEQGLAQVDAQKLQEIKEENLKKLKSLIKSRLEYKEELVPKDGKGKFNITVPVEFEFL
jgi:predicted PP-loop superfamily ATPase